MFKVYKKDTRTLNIFYTISGVSTADLDNVNVAGSHPINL